MGERIKQKTTEDDSRLVLGICNYSCTELYMLANWTPILIDFVSVCVRMEGYKVAYPSRDDPDAVEILHSDLQRLAPLEFLNDTLIDFYIKYDSLSPTGLLQKSSLQGQINKFSSADEGIDHIKFGIYSALIGGC
jgi:hypothetical protein